MKETRPYLDLTDLESSGPMSTETSSSDSEIAKRPSVCLNMIVKNEAQVIERCLQSVLPYIQSWVIVDTGSSDGTQTKIREFFASHEIPGELHERPWKDFATNRNESLELARSHGDYLLILDADEIFLTQPDFAFPDFEADGYLLHQQRAELHYWVVRLIASKSPWTWTGVLHEYLSCDNDSSDIRSLTGSYTVLSPNQGVRSQNPTCFEDDAALLVKALEDDPENTRLTFYLAQSYRDAGEDQLALQTYFKRVKMGGWGEELFISLLEMGRIQERLEHNWSTILHTHLSAYSLRPSRIESMYELVRRCRIDGNYALGYALGAIPVETRGTSDILFVEQSVYDWKMLDEYAICASWTGRVQEGLRLFEMILEEDNHPDEQTERLEENIKWCREQLEEAGEEN